MDYHSQKKEKPEIESVVRKGGIVSYKESFGKKLMKEFFADDIRDLKSYLIWEKLIPGAKNLILDGMEKLFFKEVRGRRGGRSGYDYDRSSYRAYYEGSGSSRSYYRKENERRKKDEVEDDVDCRHVVLTYREDAEAVVRKLKQSIEDYGEASVSQLFGLIGKPDEYVDNNWGWTDERDIGIRRVSDGYLIDVSEPRFLGK